MMMLCERFHDCKHDPLPAWSHVLCVQGKPLPGWVPVTSLLLRLLMLSLLLAIRRR